MRRFLFVAALFLSACATQSGMRAGNRSRLNGLTIGMSKAEALSAMGTSTRMVRGGERITNPYRTEAYQAGESSWEVLMYYTDLKREDGAITDDELTPIVIRDGKVDGWGWMYWQGVVQKYEIRVR